MKKIQVETHCKKMLADIFTPVGIYLRLRDKFRDTVLLESSDHHAAENSFSFIGINAIAGMEMKTKAIIECKFPDQTPQSFSITNPMEVPERLWDFMNNFQMHGTEKSAVYAQRLFGYTAYDALQFFETLQLKERGQEIPLIRYRLYQYVIAISHFKDELWICENRIAGLKSELHLLENIIRNKDIPTFPFRTKGKETSNFTDFEYLQIVRKGIRNCQEGNIFQIVLSRQFQQQFIGDEFNVYRALRSINPSPYLFYFDYGNYRLMGSSPESQILIQDRKAVIHPIAGTFNRTGDDREDQLSAQRLLKDTKENSEHVMLVDLARNDLSRFCKNVKVNDYKKINFFSHVIHMVSEVCGETPEAANPFDMLARTFPAGTLSGAPKFKAMQIIDTYEPTARGYYGGAIGYMGFDGSCNHAIMIRTFLSKNNTLSYQAGAGIVNNSKPEKELQEVNNKLNALKQAIVLAQNL